MLERSEEYTEFAVSQMDYIMGGKTGRSFVVGFGNNPPVRPHHRSSTCQVGTLSNNTFQSQGRKISPNLFTRTPQLRATGMFSMVISPMLMCWVALWWVPFLWPPKLYICNLTLVSCVCKCRLVVQSHLTTLMLIREMTMWPMRWHVITTRPSEGSWLVCTWRNAWIKIPDTSQ